MRYTVHHMNTEAKQRRSFLKTVFLATLVILFLFLTQPIRAFYDPLSVPNNRYGIHIADLNDIPDVAPLVNSNGGDWGYVTLVAPQTDHNTQSWQKLFDQMRRLHLIPIVRLATQLEGVSWMKPKKEDIRDWVMFLNSLNWPVANRYIILFNEPNHANEWGSTINPEEYADILVTFAKALKDANEDFFILPAGLDASAASDGRSLDEAEFLRRMVAAYPEVLEVIDGWTSHSYPNPGFSGSAYAFGRGSMRTFQWELAFLQELGLRRKLPVFITETGWVHAEGKFWQPRLLTPEAVGSNLQVASASVWQDPRIVAVTPFVFNYQDYPFDHFSFKKLGNTEFYAHYFAYQSIPKSAGRPRQRESFSASHPLLPDKLIASSRYTFTAELTNSGQSILDPGDGYQLTIDAKDFSVSDVTIPYLEPGQKGTLTYTLHTSPAVGSVPIALSITHGNTVIPLETKTVAVAAPPSVTIRAQLGWRKTSTAEGVKVLVYQANRLIHEFPGRSLVGGIVTVSGVTDIVPGQPYRIVLVVPSYLPRQKILALSERTTVVSLPRLLPLDTDKDSALTPNDILTLLKLPPAAVMSRFFGP